MRHHHQAGEGLKIKIYPYPLIFERRGHSPHLHWILRKLVDFQIRADCVTSICWWIVKKRNWIFLPRTPTTFEVGLQRMSRPLESMILVRSTWVGLLLASSTCYWLSTSQRCTTAKHSIITRTGQNMKIYVPLMRHRLLPFSYLLHITLTNVLKSIIGFLLVEFIQLNVMLYWFDYIAVDHTSLIPSVHIPSLPRTY